jgi:hypothetical protein
MFKNDYKMCKNFSPYCLLYGPCIICVYFMSNFFLYYLHRILKKYLSVVSFFFCCSIYLYVLYIYDLLHILLLPLQNYGSVECMLACTNLYAEISGLASWGENCKWYSSLPLGAVVSLFCESV